MIGVTSPIKTRIYGSDGSTKKIAVATTGVARSFHFELGQASSFSLSWNCESPGTVNVNLSVEIGDKKPDVEGTSDAQFTVPVGAGTTVNITATGYGRIGLTPALGRYAVLLLEGTGSNDAGTTIEPWVTFEYGG